MFFDDHFRRRDPSLRRCERALTRHRRLFERETFDMTKHPRDAGALVDLCERCIEPAKLDARLRRGGFVGERLERDLFAASIETEQAEELSFAEATMHQTNGDAMEPRTKRRA